MTDLTRVYTQANRDVYFRASGDLVARVAAEYNYAGNWASSTGGTYTRWNVRWLRCTVMADPLSSVCGPLRNPLQSNGDQPHPCSSSRESYQAILDSNGYFYKHYGSKGTRQYRFVLLTKLRSRYAWYGLLNLVRRNDILERRLEMYGAAIYWNQQLDPIQFVQHGTEQPIEQVLLQTS